MNVVEIDGVRYADDDYLLEDGIGTITHRLETDMANPEVGDVRIDLSDMDDTFSNLFSSISSPDQRIPVRIYHNNVIQFSGYMDIPTIRFSPDDKVFSFMAIDQQKRVARHFERITVWDVYDRMRQRLTLFEGSRESWLSQSSGNYWIASDIMALRIRAFWLTDFIETALSFFSKDEDVRPSVVRNDIPGNTLYMIFTFGRPEAGADLWYKPAKETTVLDALNTLALRFPVYWYVNLSGGFEIISRTKPIQPTIRTPEVVSVESGYHSDSFDSLSITLAEAVVWPEVTLTDENGNDVVFTNKRIYNASGTLIVREKYFNLEINYPIPTNLYTDLIGWGESGGFQGIEENITGLFADFYKQNKYLLSPRKTITAKVRGLDLNLFEMYDPTGVSRYPNPFNGSYYQIIELEKDLKDETTILRGVLR